MDIYLLITIVMLIISLLMVIFGWKGNKTINNILILLILTVQLLFLLNIIKPFGDLHRGYYAIILTAFITPMSIYSYSGKIKVPAIILFITALFYIILSAGIIHIGFGR